MHTIKTHTNSHTDTHHPPTEKKNTFQAINTHTPRTKSCLQQRVGSVSARRPGAQTGYCVHCMGQGTFVIIVFQGFLFHELLVLNNAGFILMFFYTT